MNPLPSIAPDQEWTVDLFTPEDAPGVAALFQSIYGNGYPVKTYLTPDLLITENLAGRVISSVAKTSKGDIVGHNALFNSAPFKKIFETGAGLVHADYRGGHGIFSKMVAHGIIVGREQFKVELVYGESVCNHPFSQKMCHSQGFVTRAVEVDLMPAAAYTKEASARGRVSTLLDFKTLKSCPCTVYVPKIYETLFPLFYEEMDDERRYMVSDQSLSQKTATQVSTQTFDFVQVARIAVPELGGDFETRLKKEETFLINAGIRVIQVWLPSGNPSVGQAVDCLRARGYFLGGVLPRWFDSDGLLMEKVLDDPDWSSMILSFDRSQKLVGHIKQDWENTRNFLF